MKGRWVTERLCASHPAEKALCALLVAGTVLYVGGVFVAHAANVGQADDFVDLLWFIEIFRSREQWLDALAVLFLPNHEHVTLFNHLVYVAQYAITGKVSFLLCMVIGQGLVLGCCAVLAGWLRRWLDAWYATALAVTLFYSLFYWHAGFWAMTALSNQGVILFALLAVRAASRDPGAVWVPLAWSLAAVGTQFNGLLVLPALLAGRWWVQQCGGAAVSARQWQVWGLAFVVSVAAYIAYENPFAADHLWRYVQYTDPGKLAEYTKPSSAGAVGYGGLGSALLTLPVLVGATVFGESFWVPAAMLGLLMLVLLLLACRPGVAGRDGFFMALLCFVLASVLLVAIGRGLAFGPESGLLYRYRLYPFLLLVLLAGVWLASGGGKVRVWLALALAVGVQGLSWPVQQAIAAERERVQRSHYFWLVDGGMGRTQMPFYPHNQDWRLFNAYRDGYYHPYEALPRRWRPADMSTADAQMCQQPAQPVADQVTVWSKKPRALASEIRVALSPSAPKLVMYFCADTAAFRVVLDQANVDTATASYHAVAVLKSALPPAEYRVRWQTADGLVQQAARVSFP